MLSHHGSFITTNPSLTWTFTVPGRLHRTSDTDVATPSVYTCQWISWILARSPSTWTTPWCPDLCILTSDTWSDASTSWQHYALDILWYLTSTWSSRRTCSFYILGPYHQRTTWTFTVYNLLHMISRYIWTTWDRFLYPSSMDLRWSDETDDVFALHEEDKLLDLLNFHRPHWTQGQEYGMIGRVLFPNEQIRRFSSPNQPFIMRMSCHEALPNRNTGVVSVSSLTSLILIVFHFWLQL